MGVATLAPATSPTQNRTTGPLCAALTRAQRAEAGRRVSAGLRPAPGTLAKLPTWYGPKHWVEVAVPQACASAPHTRPVDPHTLQRIARIFASFADRRTGRNCRPTNELIAELAGCCVRTVQRARRYLEDLGLLVVVQEGRSIMTRSERLRAWRNGSSVRQLAAEVALILPREVARVLRRPSRSVDDVTPPGEALGRGVKSRDLGFLNRRSRSMRTASPPSPTSRGRSGPVTPAQARARRLAAGVQQRITWLRDVSPRRLTVLHRFAAQRWTPRDVHRALDEVLRARAWSVPGKLDQPAAYLATLLRDVDPADRPGAIDEAMLATERERRAWIYARDVAGTLPECAHGQPAGDVPHPQTGIRHCAQCRRAREATTT